MYMYVIIQHIHIWCRDQDLGPEYGPFMVLRFFKGPIVFGRMKDASVLYFDARMSR